MRSSWNTSAARDELNSLRGAAPDAIILGSGLAGLADRIDSRLRIPYTFVPGLGATSVEGHPGFVSLGRIAGEPVLIFAGRFHRYEGLAADASAEIVSIAASAACARIIVTQAAGSLTPRVHPGTWMLATDVLSFPARLAGDLGRAPRRGYDQPDAGRGRGPLVSARFSATIREAAREASVPFAEGVLCWSSGPAYETAAEARSAAIMGADAVTMSSIPELVAARRLGLEAAALSWITNHTVNVSGTRTDHTHVVGSGEAGVRTLEGLLAALFRARRTV